MMGSLPKNGKHPEKYSNFAQTCNLLRQYLKRGWSLGDIMLGIKDTEGFETTRPMETTISNGDNSADTSGKFKSLDNLPLLAAYGTISDSRTCVPTAPEAAQMTIFYCGQVIVLDDLPADKAKEIMDLAYKYASPSSANGFLPISTNENGFNPTNSAASDNNNNNNNVQEQLQSQATGSSDLPLARRASLRRFLEKRKDRVAARAPYQINKTPDLALHRTEHKSLWIDLEDQTSKHLELRL